MEYKITKGECSQFSVSEENYDSKCKEIKAGITVRFNYDTDSRILRCAVCVDMLQHDKSLVKCECRIHFEFSEASAQSFNSGDKVQIDRGILIQFASITYGSLRGILIAKSNDIPFAIPVLPPVYMQQIVQNDLILD